MNDLKIERRILEATNRYVLIGQLYKLSFDCNEDDSFNAYWNAKDKCWSFLMDGNYYKVDPLSALLVSDKSERYTLGDDCHQSATVAKLIDRPVGWIHSFQCAWKGFDNKANSISGYLLGLKLRNKYLQGF